MQINQYTILKNSEGIAGTLFSLCENLIITYYKYTGLEDTAIEFDDIERALFASETAVLFKNKQGKIDCLPCAVTQIDYKGKAKTVQPFALTNPYAHINEKTVYKNGENCVVIYNNASRTSYCAILAPYLKKLSTIWKNALNNLEISNVFGIFQTSALNKSAVQNALDGMIKRGFGVVAINEKALLKEIEKFDLQVPYMADKYNEDFMQTFQQMLNAVGINSNPYAKKERMIVDEVNSNNEFLERCDNSFYLYRKNALEKANKLWGSNLNVEKQGNNSVENGKDNARNGRDNERNVDNNGETL